MLRVAKQQLGTNKFTHAVYLFVFLFCFGSRPTQINALFIVMRKSPIASRVQVRAISVRRTHIQRFNNIRNNIVWINDCKRLYGINRLKMVYYRNFGSIIDYCASCYVIIGYMHIKTPQNFIHQLLPFYEIKANSNISISSPEAFS